MIVQAAILNLHCWRSHNFHKESSLVYYYPHKKKKVFLMSTLLQFSDLHYSCPTILHTPRIAF